MKNINSSFLDPQSHPFTPFSIKKRLFLARFKVSFWILRTLSYRFIKRTMDIAGSLAALLIFSPLILFITYKIKKYDNGPIFFSQPRAGKNTQLFNMYKFRSMVLHAEDLLPSLKSQNVHGNSGVTFKIKDDPRITPIGKWIRKYSFDELPQLFNVLKGEMSLVGPRPPLIEEVIQYRAIHLRRLVVKPGITCFWQISGRSNIGFEDQVLLDLQYIHSQSFFTDLKILILTLPAVFKSHGAY